MTTPAPGWYPDPAGSSGTRWWDGAQWTEHLQPAAGAPAAQPAGSWQSSSASWGGASQTGASSWGASAPAYPQTAEPQNFWRQNRYSLSAIGFAVLYVVLLLSVHIALIGIVPVLFTVRAWRAKEQLAIAATIVAAAAVVLVIYGLSR